MLYKHACSSLRAAFLFLFSITISSVYNPTEQHIDWEGKVLSQHHCPSILSFTRLSLPCGFHLIMSGNRVTCIKLHLFTTDWTWTCMTVPLSYDIIPHVCLWIFFGIVTVKNLVKSTYVFKRNIDVFSV